MAGVSLKRVDKHYGRFHALKDISLDINEGEFVVLVGPSGCGKSTLLRSIAGLETITNGSIAVDGRDVTAEEPRDRGVAMVFQSYALYPHLTAAENMGFALRLAGQDKATRRVAVEKAARILQIESLLDKKPRQLSGGQRQRVAIGRAIVRDPAVFLFDEPLSNLDAELRATMRVELSRLHRDLGATMIYVTHDQIEAMTMADRIVLLRDGVIEQFGAPEHLYDQPANRFVAGFLGSPKMTFFEGTVHDQRIETEGVGAFTPAARVPDGPVIWGVRPEDVHIGEGPGDAVVIDAIVELEERLGRETILYARPVSGRPVDSTFITAQLPREAPLHPGERLTLRVRSDRLHLFDANGQRLAGLGEGAAP
ncbi:ABC transporter ATP-binding protein [Bauldia sp.]|uniref:ABC transporter ATP-binding protein n=1 Tax=Bauldia sp. TaxID=2575872 RepID=UPI003BAC0ECB